MTADGKKSEAESSGGKVKAQQPEAVAIGASAGALEALSNILRSLPADFRLPVITVVHVPPDKKSVLVELLGRVCAIPVREAEDKEPIEAGTIYFAPPDYHLLIETTKRFALSNDEPVQFSRPSIDVLFESAADAYGPGLIGVVLTGANSDGALGLKAIVDSGGEALVQCPDTAYAPAMPQAALVASPKARSLTLEEIAAYLKQAAQL